MASYSHSSPVATRLLIDFSIPSPFQVSRVLQLIHPAPGVDSIFLSFPVDPSLDSKLKLHYEGFKAADAMSQADSEDFASTPSSPGADSANDDLQSLRAWTIPKLTAELRRKGIPYPATARKADLFRLLFSPPHYWQQSPTSRQEWEPWRYIKLHPHHLQ
ncbi:hypothetical protein AB205_0047030 [Aquarana catesbeiana]|uniref:HeH/LEM domain-containing protein n=1 Tax=Aquarana catesbeiana TaxID=8400 RepID=A0A2G9Q4N5_AQUCT|nr:hypothetical protein AB205_0047030 [Aquarana catesbeiana]